MIPKDVRKLIKNIIHHKINESNILLITHEDIGNNIYIFIYYVDGNIITTLSLNCDTTEKNYKINEILYINDEFSSNNIYINTDNQRVNSIILYGNQFISSDFMIRSIIIKDTVYYTLDNTEANLNIIDKL